MAGVMQIAVGKHRRGFYHFNPIYHLERHNFPELCSASSQRENVGRMQNGMHLSSAINAMSSVFYQLCCYFCLKLYFKFVVIQMCLFFQTGFTSSTLNCTSFQLTQPPGSKKRLESRGRNGLVRDFPFKIGDKVTGTIVGGSNGWRVALDYDQNIIG
jgi:hypothetical protein